MRFILIFFSICLSSIVLSGQVTYTEDIAPLIYENCANCHRPGEIGPFSLTNYDEVTGWGQMIKFVTESRYMPPWKPDPDYSSFLGEAHLSQDEIAMIAAWVDNGMPRGDESLEPEFPNYPDGSLLGEPDLVLSMEQAHMHRGNNRDSYYYFVLPTGLTEDRVVKAVEFRPGNAKIVHHALIFEDNEGIARETDAQTPEYGFESFGSFNGDQNDITFLSGKQFNPYAPGQKTTRYPDGLGQIMKAGSDLAVQIHYAPSANDEWDQSSLNIFFADEDEEVERVVEQHIMLPTSLPGSFAGFIMLPGQEREFVGTYLIREDISLMGIFPHAHLLGKEWEVHLEHPDGSITNLISIPDWDFNWQSQYYFDRLIKAEKGTKVIARAVYDNTVDNPNNPNNPPKLVHWGDRTEDEMFYLPFLYVPYKDGDEDIRFDGTVAVEEHMEQVGNRLLPLYPNPVDSRVTAAFHLKQGGPINLTVLDMNGQIVRQLRKGEYFPSRFSQISFVTDQLSEGIYLLQLKGKDFKVSEKFVKQ